jgi:hypothetical protein
MEDVAKLVAYLGGGVAHVMGMDVCVAYPAEACAQPHNILLEKASTMMSVLHSMTIT